MTLRFRHLDVGPEAPVEEWPTEGVLAALERGGLSDWRRLAVAVRADPWGPVARRLEDALAASRPYGAAPLMERVLAHARRDAAHAERAEVARRVRTHLEGSGLDRAAFAEAIGTSTSRLSTYLTGTVAPSSTLLVRMERAARGGVSAAGGPADAPRGRPRS
ncbi:MAG: helix-turn-helix domain-containing protein [Trueperaceae bacterium]